MLGSLLQVVKTNMSSRAGQAWIAVTGVGVLTNMAFAATTKLYVDQVEQSCRIEVESAKKARQMCEDNLAAFKAATSCTPK
jgi:hypothetical protein